MNRLQNVIIVALCFVTCACCPCNPKPRDGIRATWTVMVFMNAVNNLEPDSVNNFKQISQVGSSDKINVIVQYGRKAWPDARRFRVIKGASPNDTPLMSIPNPDMGSEATLEDFVSWAKQRFPADHYMLVIWDHGQGWRLEMKATSAHSLVVKDSMHAAPGRMSNFRSISYDERTKHNLYNSDIAQVVAKEHVDVIAFDACLMSMVETGYAVRGGAAVMVGSEELEPGPGWDYQDWLKTFTGNAGADPQSAARMIVDSYRKTYSATDGTTTMAAVDLSQMTELANLTSVLADMLIAELANDLSGIKAARLGCNVFAPDPFGDGRDYFQHVDLAGFCDQLQAHATSANIRTAAMNVRHCIERIILADYAGSERQGNFASHGLAIYFPQSKALYESDPYAQNGYEKTNQDHPVAFVRDLHWADFLHAYFAQVP